MSVLYLDDFDKGQGCLWFYIVLVLIFILLVQDGDLRDDHCQHLFFLFGYWHKIRGTCLESVLETIFEVKGGSYFSRGKWSSAKMADLPHKIIKISFFQIFEDGYSSDSLPLMRLFIFIIKFNILWLYYSSFFYISLNTKIFSLFFYRFWIKMRKIIFLRTCHCWKNNVFDWSKYCHSSQAIYT